MIVAEPAGRWEGEGFNLSRHLAGSLPQIEVHEAVAILHNDAVCRG